MKKSIRTAISIITVLLAGNFIQANTVITSASKFEFNKSNQLQAVYDAYFTVKDALIKSDSKLTSAKAKDY